MTFQFGSLDEKNTGRFAEKIKQEQPSFGFSEDSQWKKERGQGTLKDAIFETGASGVGSTYVLCKKYFKCNEVSS